jgi:hypothetical protein
MKFDGESWKYVLLTIPRCQRDGIRVRVPPGAPAESPGQGHDLPGKQGIKGSVAHNRVVPALYFGVVPTVCPRLSHFV